MPTYNERENLKTLVERIDSSLKGRSYEVIIVDDNSPDKTWSLAQELAEFYPVKVIRRIGKRSLSSAIVDGFSHASGRHLVVMDADLQHPPEIIPKLIEAIENGADIAIASRYIKGGGIEGWTITRKIISLGAVFLARMLLTRVKDPMSGFFALKKKVIEGVELKPKGYKILLEILAKGKHTKTAEIPYIFQPRKHGKSKLNMKEYGEYIRHLMALMRYKFGVISSC